MEFLSGQTNIKVLAYTTSRTPITLLSASGSPIDVTGYTFTAKIRQTLAAASVLGTFTVNSISPTNGQIELYLSATDTTNLWTAASALYTSSPTSGYLFLYWDLLGAAPAAGDTTKFLSGTMQLGATASH